MAFTDNFNRANADLEASAVSSGGSSWTHDGLVASALQIVSNQLRCNTTNSSGSAYKAADAGTSDHYVQFSAVAVSLSTGPFVCCRLADRSNFVGVRVGNIGSGNGQIEVYRRVGGTLTSLHLSAVGAAAANDIIKLETSGTNWLLYVNGSLLSSGAINSAGLTSTGTGIVARTTTGTYFDDFESAAIPVDITGTMDADEPGSDTISSFGDVLISGSFVVSESGSDIASLSGSVLISGNILVTEIGPDVVSFSGSILISGSLSAIEIGSDSFSTVDLNITTPSFRISVAKSSARIVEASHKSRLHTAGVR